VIVIDFFSFVNSSLKLCSYAQPQEVSALVAVQIIFLKKYQIEFALNIACISHSALCFVLSIQDELVITHNALSSATFSYIS